MTPFLWAMAILFGVGLLAFLAVIPWGYRLDRRRRIDPLPTARRQARRVRGRRR
ncbi:MAG: hypothetical protein K6U14_01280 [Firmicutes bacterium]|nr:hypothetical protein [Alicyclobacillaceae bacterium]MCL6496251.1 hypothetical protein [Bacillota bacterium]